MSLTSPAGTPSAPNLATVPVWSQLPLTTETVQAILDENKELIRACQAYQNAGKVAEMNEYQNRLHQNLSYLASLADRMIQPARKS